MNIRKELRSIIFNLCAIIAFMARSVSFNNIYIDLTALFCVLIFSKWIADSAQSIIDKVICYELIKKGMISSAKRKRESSEKEVVNERD